MQRSRLTVFPYWIDIQHPIRPLHWHLIYSTSMHQMGFAVFLQINRRFSAVWIHSGSLFKLEYLAFWSLSSNPTGIHCLFNISGGSKRFWLQLELRNQTSMKCMSSWSELENFILESDSLWLLRHCISKTHEDFFGLQIVFVNGERLFFSVNDWDFDERRLPQWI